MSRAAAIRSGIDLSLLAWNAMLTVLVCAGGCARPSPVPISTRPPAASVERRAGAADHPDTLAAARQLVIDVKPGELRLMVDRLATRVCAEDPVDSLALARVLEIWSEHAAQPNAPFDSTAYAWARMSVRVKDRALGPGHHELANSLGTFAALADLAREATGASAARERAIGILMTRQGRHREGLMTLLDDEGRAAYARNEVVRAESLLQAAVAEGRAAGLKGQPRFQSVLNNLAIILADLGSPYEALRIQRELLALRLREYGPVHRRVQLTRINNASLLVSLGDYEPALEHLRDALTVDSLLEGQGASRRPAILQNLSAVHDDMGDLAAARRAIEGMIQAQRDTTPYYRVLLAQSYRKTGDLGLARTLYQTGIRGLRETNGYRNQVAFGLAGLASLELDEGHPERALRLHREALAIRLDVHGPSHVNTANSVLALAGCELEMGHLDSAAVHADSGARVLRRARPEGHPAHAEAMQLQARILERRGQLEAAEVLLEGAGALVSTAIGDEHPRHVTVLREVARLAAARGDTVRAADAARRAARLHRRIAKLSLTSFTESEAIAFVAQDVGPLHDVLLLAERSGNRFPGLNDRALDELVRSRALVLDATLERRSGEFAPAADSARRQLLRARRSLARLWMAGLRERSPGTYRALLDSAWTAVEAAERALSGLSTMPSRRAMEGPGLDEVRASLPRGAVLVSYVRRSGVWKSESPGGRGTGARAESGDTYLAFVLRAGEATVRMVPLGDASRVDSAVESWRSGMRTDTRTAGAESSYRRMAASLRRLAWDPLQSHVAGASRLYVVPDGELQRLDLAALPLAGGGYLLESLPPVAMLTSELDLLTPVPTTYPTALVAMGDPDFDADPALGVPVPLASRPRRGVDRCDEFARRRFAALPASGLEVLDVERSWTAARVGRAVVLRRQDASESRFRQSAPLASDLHLATHGFFLPERCEWAGAEVAHTSPHAYRTAMETASFRCGLALAGANRRTGAASAEDDGLLTAEEIASLDLRGTRCVVLSACETAQGEPLAGEGVFGLLRSFRLAGSRSLVMSLWPVEDAQARAWMARFYSGRWGGGQDVAASAWSASRALLLAQRGAGRSTHPATWGGFIVIGRE